MSDKPVKSRSRKIQKHHLRRYEGGKVTVVNKGVDKIKPVIKRVSDAESKNLMKSKGNRLTNRFSGSGLIDKRKFFVSPPVTWRNVFNLVKGPTALELEARKEKESKELNLRPGERFARKVLDYRMEQSDNEFMRGGIKIDIINEKGEKEQLLVELGEYTPVFDRFTHYLKNIKGTNKKMIFKEKNFIEDVLSNPQMMKRDSHGFGFAMSNGDLEYIRDVSTGVIFRKDPDKRPPHGLFKGTNDSIILADVDSEGNPLPDGRKREFPDYQAFEKANLRSLKHSEDLLGRKWESQDNLAQLSLIEEIMNDPFTKGGQVAFNQFLMSPNFSEAIVFENNGKFKVFLTNEVKQLIPEATKVFDNFDDARLYMIEFVNNYGRPEELKRKLTKDDKIDRVVDVMSDSAPRVPKDFVFKRWVKNNLLREAVVERVKGGYVVSFTNGLDFFEEHLSKRVRDLNQAKQYIDFVERNYHGQ